MKLGQIKLADRNIVHTNQIVLADPVFQAFTKQRALLAMQTLNKATSSRSLRKSRRNHVTRITSARSLYITKTQSGHSAIRYSITSWRDRRFAGNANASWGEHLASASRRGLCRANGVVPPFVIGDLRLGPSTPTSAKTPLPIVAPSPHCCRATSAALMPSSARPKVTPSSMMRRSFWVSAMRVYFVVSDGSFVSSSAISRAR
jgi:hypothetical protein